MVSSLLCFRGLYALPADIRSRDGPPVTGSGKLSSDRLESLPALPGVTAVLPLCYPGLASVLLKSSFRPSPPALVSLQKTPFRKDIEHPAEGAPLVRNPEDRLRVRTPPFLPE
jgi:hypothetical protein